MKIGEICVVSVGLGAVSTLAWVAAMNDKQGNNLRGKADEPNIKPKNNNNSKQGMER